MLLKFISKIARPLLIRGIFLLACLPLLYCLLFLHDNSPNSWRFKLAESPSSQTLPAKPISQTIPYPQIKFQHAVSLLQLTPNDVLATWYAGSTEHNADTQIMLGHYNISLHKWHDIHPVMSRKIFLKQQHRYIHTLGNPVLSQQDRRIYLYFVSTFGGWSASSLQVISSSDEGKHWSNAHTLMTSPLLNISTLIKTGAVHYQDGSIGLPAYHELGNKNALLLHIHHNAITESSRISWNGHTLQPLVIPLSDKTAIAFMRNSGQKPRYIQMSITHDAGRTWSPTTNTSMPNPDAAISGLYLHHHIVIAFNPLHEGRQKLVIATYSLNTNRWKLINTIANKKQGNFSYPYLISLMPNKYMLGYSSNQKIKTLLFNNRWLEQKWT